MQVKSKVLLVGCLASILFANDATPTTGIFVFNKEPEKRVLQTPALKEEGNIIYITNISGVGESLEIAKKDAIQNAMKFGVGEYLVSKEELNNDELKQEVMNYSNAYVLDYKQISETNNGGIYKVVADVTLEKSKVLGTLSKLNINHMDLSSGVLKNYTEDTASKKENAEKLIKSEIIDPFRNGQAYNLEILDIQPINRSDLVKARAEKGNYFKNERIYIEAINKNLTDSLFVAKVKIKMNENYVTKAEKTIIQFSEKLSQGADNEKQPNLKFDNRLYFVPDRYIREELFGKNLVNLDLYGVVFRLFDNEDELWLRRCAIEIGDEYEAASLYTYRYGNEQREFINNEIPYSFNLKQIRKFKENDKKDGIEYSYKDDKKYSFVWNLPHFVSPRNYVDEKYSYFRLGKPWLLTFNTKEQIFHIVIQLDKQDIENTKRIEFDLLYAKDNECTIKE